IIIRELVVTGVRAIAAEPHLRLRAISRAHSTLEDVFLAATRRSWDVVDDAPAPAAPAEPPAPQP
ncbi:MAG TPA: hypothetical protein PLE80_09030, partial [Opitutaceae bacterium]|nr:hypothetical protein [Opitutaceae bacterium]